MSASAEIQPPPDRRDGRGRAPGRIRLASAVYDAGDFASLLQISERHIWKLRDAGLLPECIRIGRLVRWPRTRVDEWIHQGCPGLERGGAP
jgi:excisionase family DNA binding protein